MHKCIVSKQAHYIDASLGPAGQELYMRHDGLDMPMMHVWQELPGRQGSPDHERTLLGQLPSEDGGLGGGSRNAQLADRYLSHEAVYILAPWYATLAGATMCFNNASQSRLDRQQEPAAVGQVWHSTCPVYQTTATKKMQTWHAKTECWSYMKWPWSCVTTWFSWSSIPFAPSPLLQGTKWSWILARHLEWWADDAADLGRPNGGGHESWSWAKWFGSPIGLALESVYQLTGY